MKKAIISALLVVSMGLMLVGCGAKKEETKTINIAYQYGLAYAPLTIAKDQGLIESEYEKLTGNKVTVEWTQMNSGADINTGIASKSISVGFMGVGPAVTGVMNNVGYKVFTNLSGAEHGLMTNNADIKSLSDLIGSEHQIALVNIGSIQHVILAKALANQGLDPHALDSNIVAMKHPDGMASLQSNSIACHLTSNPYIYQERDDSALTEIPGISEAWPVENSFIVGVAATDLYDSDKQLYEAICNAFKTSVDYINANLEEAAKVTSEVDGNTLEDEIRFMKESNYQTETKGLFELATFMAENGFIDAAPNSYSDLVYDNVVGD